MYIYLYPGSSLKISKIEPLTPSPPSPSPSPSSRIPDPNTPTPHHPHRIIQHGKLAPKEPIRVAKLEQPAQRLRHHQPRQLQPVLHPDIEPAVAPLKRRLRNGPVAAGPHDGLDHVVLRPRDDADEIKGQYPGAVFAQDETRAGAGDAQLEGVREGGRAGLGGVRRGGFGWC
ncbi:MAG: hypothetical protein ALECFALPRED_004500 [Alectoria fallacina]|uniref:Uncharacterized protein n=1 Tax=Alectoria fallacina TaxID=1903189 RepID=A0A8H3IVN4_9LECA|nr:MAG: hypothetical protein ALECFALPRED_004500 [Alectoria fallacina]